jgi:hypothetical protein
MSNSNSNDAASQRKIFIGGLSYSTDDGKNTFLKLTKYYEKCIILLIILFL